MRMGNTSWEKVMILEMVRAAQASPEIMGFVGSAPELVTLLA